MQEKMLSALKELCEKVANNGLIAVGAAVFNANELLPLEPTSDPVEVELRKVCEAYTESLITFGAAVYNANEFLYDYERTHQQQLTA